MGLKTDIELAFYSSMWGESFNSVNDITEEDKGNIPILAKNLSNAIIDFIQAQTFQITDMEATVDIEEIRTVTPLTGVPIPPTTGGPVIIGSNGPSPVPLPFVLSKRGGAGGFMVSIGKAYIGPKSANNVHNHNTDNEQLTKVQLKKIKKGTR